MIQPRTLFLAIATSFALGVSAGPVVAQPADSPPPSAADIEAAKKAFGEGKAAFDAKKFKEASEKFKESYRLSKRPTLLYNIALALDEDKQPDVALFYYKKFMAEAPADDAQRPLAEARIKALAPPAPTTGTTPTTTPTTGTTPTTAPDPVKPKPRTAGPIVVAPAGTYSANDFQHRIVDEAPPNKALDVTATVPTDSGFAVTLFYRGSGEANFTALPMKWRYNELVGRIPAAKMNGTSVQYYLEVKDQAGTMITKVAKPASPNLIYMEANAKSNLYPDWDYDTAKLTAVPESGKVVDDTTTTTTTTTATDDNPLAGDTSDDPLGAGEDTRVAQVETPEVTTPGGNQDAGPGGGGGGFMDVGSTKFTVVKWTTSALAVGAFVAAGLFYKSALDSAGTLEDEADSADCFGGEAPPCVYDDYLQDTESTGKNSETFFYVSLGAGAVIGGVAIYYWIKDLKGSSARETPSKTVRGKKKSRTFIAAPSVGDGVLGGTAAWEW